jgi:pimeloyl-ACP methyl ester carboxylesterase
MNSNNSGNKTFIALILFLFIILCINVFAESNYPFAIKKSGHGEKSIIFIPGFACSGDVWNDTKSKFEDRFTCYALTMPGFAGRAAEESPSFSKWTESIARFISENKIEKPVIIGHSMGGGLALAIAADHPELVGKIVVVDALPCLAAIMNPAFKSKENNDCSGIVAQITSASYEQFRQMQKGSVVRLASDTSKHEQIIEWSMLSDRKTFAEMYCDFMNTDLRSKISSVRCPSLILLEPDFKNMSGAVEEQYRNLKSADLQYAGQGLHFIMFDDREWYLGQLNKFIVAE